MSGVGTSLVKSPDGLSKRSISGCISIRDASPGFEIRAASPNWARASRGAIGHEEGPAAHDDCDVGCVNEVVVDAVD
jgi:hypothetical protein